MAENVSPEAHEAYTRIHASDEFRALRGSYLRFVVPTTVAFMLWYLLYVVCSNWAPDLMNARLFGTINVALVFGLLQFVTTFGIAWLYARYSARRMDPVADAIREDFESVTDGEVGR